VTPWPAPERPTLPELPAGAAWNRAGWFGAVLTATAILRDDEGRSPARGQRVRDFLVAAWRASAGLLGV
jgi:hypothetical protein